MTHETCTLILQCLVSCSCQKSSVKRAIQGHSGQMFSKTMLIGLSIFRCGHEKSVHGRPSWELAPYDCTSQIKFAPRGANLFQRNAAPVSAPESAERFTFRRNFLFWTRLRPIRKGSQTAWQAIRLDFIDNKDKMIAKDYELHGRCEFLC